MSNITSSAQSKDLNYCIPSDRSYTPTDTKNFFPENPTKGFNGWPRPMKVDFKNVIVQDKGEGKFGISFNGKSAIFSPYDERTTKLLNDYSKRTGDPKNYLSQLLDLTVKAEYGKDNKLSYTICFVEKYDCSDKQTLNHSSDDSFQKT